MKIGGDGEGKVKMFLRHRWEGVEEGWVRGMQRLWGRRCEEMNEWWVG